MDKKTEEVIRTLAQSLENPLKLSSRMENGIEIYKLSDELRAEPCTWLSTHPGYKMEMHDEIMQFLHDNGFKTMDDVTKRKKEIPPNYWREMKRKVIFNF